MTPPVPTELASAPSAAEPFGARLHRATSRRGPLCVGIDPHPALLEAWGLRDDAQGLERFALTVVEALADRVAVLKPQSAFFERHGSRGVAVLEQVLARCREGGALSIVDAKRGDIGSTMSAYADAYAGESSPLAGDAVTASPYLGFGSLRPLLDLAAQTGRGVFVLALTSNAEGAQVQRALGPQQTTVAAGILDQVARENAGAGPLGSVGAVVGATVDDPDYDLSRLNGPLLAPGIGAQGASVDDLRRVFGTALPLVLPSSSREVLAAGPGLASLRSAAERTVDACRAALQAPASVRPT